MPVYRDKEKKTYYVKFRYKDYAGKSHTTTKRGFATKTAAKDYETDFRRKAARTTDMKFSSLYELFIADRKVHLRSGTIRTKISQSINFLPQLGDIPINNITPVVIREWQNGLIAGEGRNGPLKPSTLASVNGQLSSVMNYAVKYFGLPNNPVRIAGGIGKKRTKMDFWEKDTFDKFISYVDDVVMYNVFNTLFYSGMRIGELLALQRKDIDFDENKISISKTMNLYGSHEVSEPKTESSTRSIYMPGFIMDMLHDYLDRMAYEPEYLFDLTYKEISYHFSKYIKAAEVKKMNIHGLRHSHVSYLINLKVPITAISKRLGHINPKITLEFYAHMYKDDDVSIAKMMEKEAFVVKM